MEAEGQVVLRCAICRGLACHLSHLAGYGMRQVLECWCRRKLMLSDVRYETASFFEAIVALLLSSEAGSVVCLMS